MKIYFYKGKRITKLDNPGFVQKLIVHLRQGKYTSFNCLIFDDGLITVGRLVDNIDALNTLLYELKKNEGKSNKI